MQADAEKYSGAICKDKVETDQNKKRKVNVTTLLIAADSRVVESVNINYKF